MRISCQVLVFMQTGTFRPAAMTVRPPGSTCVPRANHSLAAAAGKSELSFRCPQEKDWLAASKWSTRKWKSIEVVAEVPCVYACSFVGAPNGSCLIRRGLYAAFSGSLPLSRLLAGNTNSRPMHAWARPWATTPRRTHTECRIAPLGCACAPSSLLRWSPSPPNLI